MKVPKAILQELAAGESASTFHRVTSDLVAQGRWGASYKMVFTDGQQFWESCYARTDEGTYYPNQPDQVECEEVWPYQTTKTAYHKIGPGSYGEPWKVCWDGDQEDGCYMGIGTARSSDPDILIYEDAPSDRDIRLNQRMIDCVNFCAGVEELSGSLLSILEAVK